MDCVQPAAISARSDAPAPRCARIVFDELVDDLVGGHAFGLGVEVGDDAVAQHRVGDRADVVART